jgi:hypothetical protein
MVTPAQATQQREGTNRGENQAHGKSPKLIKMRDVDGGNFLPNYSISTD